MRPSACVNEPSVPSELGGSCNNSNAHEVRDEEPADRQGSRQGA